MEKFPTHKPENREVAPKIKEGVSIVFEQNPELAIIGNMEQYSNYLETIFPSREIREIVYHGTTSQEKFDKFRLKYGGDESYQGYYFADTLFQAGAIGGNDGRVFPVILDAHPKLGTWGITATKEDIETAKKEGFDALREVDEERGKNFNTTIVFSPTQIHILGSKTDLEKFREFVANEKSDSDSPALPSVPK